MKFEVREDVAHVAVAGADILEALVRDRPEAVVVLPTGRTPIAMYREMAQRVVAGKITLGGITTFNLDEVLLKRSDSRTFFQFMKTHAWGPLGIDESRAFIPDCEASDPLAECDRYEAEIARHPRFDVAFLGIGQDGHVAYNLPRQVQARTHVVTLDAATAAALGESAQTVRAITMGIKTIASARRLVMLATGPRKRDALRRLRDSEPSPEFPASLLKDHPSFLVIADKEAAASL